MAGFQSAADKGRAEAAAKGKSEQEAQQQREAQQKAAVKAGTVGNTGAGFGGGRVGFDAQGNRTVDGKIVSFASQSNYESYLASHGLSNTLQVQNPDVFAKADFSDIGGPNNATTILAGLASTAKPSMGTYGYTSDAKLSPNVPKEFTPNPESLSFETTLGARGRFEKTQPSGGGVETPQSKGKSFGTKWVNAQSQKEGKVTFSNQQQVYRGTGVESLLLASEAARAEKNVPQTSNAEYAFGGAKEAGQKPTLGKAQAFFGKTPSGEYGVKDVAPSMFYRGDAKERAAQVREANRAAGKPNVIPISFTENVGVNENIGGNVFSSAPAPIQTTKPTSTFNPQQQRAFADYVSSYANQGASIQVFAGTKQVGVFSGPNAYRDIVQLEGRYNQPLEARVVPSTIRSQTTGQTLPETLITSAEKSGAKTIDVVLTSGKGKGSVIESIPVSEASARLPGVIDKYSSNNNIGFFITPAQISSPKETTIIASSVTPIDIGNVASKEFTGQYFDLKQFVGKESARYTGYSNPLDFFAGKPPNYPKESGLNKPLLVNEKNQPSDRLPIPLAAKEFTQNLFARTVIQPAKSIPPLAAGVGREFYDLLRTGKSGAVPSKPTDIGSFGNVFVGGILYPESLFSSKATQSSSRVAGFEHQQIGKPLAQSGIILPQVVQNPKTVGAEVGTITAFGAMFGRGLPLVSRFGFVKTSEIVTAEGKQVPIYQGLIFGSTPGKSELIGKVGGKIKFGRVSYEEFRPKESEIVIPNPKRGIETATPSRYESNLLSSPQYWERVTNIGKASRPIEGELVSATKTQNIFLSNPATNIQYSKTLETGGREGISEPVVKGGLIGTGKLQSKLSFLRPSTGRAGPVQGSTSTEQFLQSDLASQVKPHDIDVIKTNPLGILEEKQAVGSTKFINTQIQTEQGITPAENVGFHATSRGYASTIASKGINFEASKRGGGFFTMNEVTPRFGDYVVKVEYEPKQIMKFEELPKSEREKLVSRNWLSFQENVMEYGKSEGKSGVTKPYYTTRYGEAGFNPKSPIKEIIFFNKSPIKSIKNLGKIQFTTAQGRRIFTEKGEKVLEVVTRKDETGSSTAKSGTVYGIPINEKTFISTVKGTQQPVRHTSGIFQAQTNISKMGIQSAKSAREQGAKPEQLAIIGKGEYFGPELFAGKAIQRTYLQTIGTFRSTFRNPELKAQAFKALEAAHKTRYYQFENPKTALYKWNEVTPKENAKQVESSTLRPSNVPASSLVSSISRFSVPLSSKAASSKSSVSTKSSVSQRSSISSRVPSSISSVLSIKSGKSSIPSRSSFISKSPTSSKPSSFSSKRRSSLIPSIFSETPSSSSQVSSFTGSSSTSSGISGFSGFSSIPPSYGQSSYLPPSRTIIKPIIYGNIGIRRKNKNKEGPTGLLKLGTVNIFASGFSISVPKNQRYEF